MGQPAVSRIEQASYSGWTYKTLARVAEKLNARLRIIYEPLEDVIARMDADGESVTEISAGSTDREAVAEVEHVQPPASSDQKGAPYPEDPRDWSFASQQRAREIRGHVEVPYQ